MEKQADLLTEYAEGHAPKRNLAHAHTRPNKDNAASSVWDERMLQQIIHNADRLQQTVATLRKHLPAVYHERVRVNWTEKAWTLSVERPVLANELGWITSKLCAEIEQDIGFSPTLKIICAPKDWGTSGVLLRHPERPQISLPTTEEADKFIDDLLRTS